MINEANNENKNKLFKRPERNFYSDGCCCDHCRCSLLFLVPSHTSVSSISGLGIVLTNFIPLPLSAISMILNIALLIIGFFTCGREFGVKTVYTSIMLPFFLWLFEMILPDFGSMTNSQELDVLCYILVVSVGLSILFNRNASSGGLDIVAKILNKYAHIDLGKAMSLSGMCVALSAALVYDKKTVVLSILGTYFNGMVLDHFIFDHNIKRRVCIITKKEEELRNFIIHDLHSGATIMNPSEPTTCKRETRSLPSWTNLNIRNL